MASPPSTAPAADPGDAGWTTEIRPQTGWMDWRLGELWRCRDLIALFVWRDFVSVYKQTVLGPLWHLIQPLLTTITFTVIFGRVAGLPTDGAPPFLFYMAGNIVWVYFSGCLTKTANTFVGNAALLGKVYFHRLAIPVSVASSAHQFRDPVRRLRSLPRMVHAPGLPYFADRRCLPGPGVDPECSPASGWGAGSSPPPSPPATGT